MAIVPENQLPEIKEVADRVGGSNRSLPSIAELRASQAKGAAGNGLNEYDHNYDEEIFGQNVEITED